MLASVAGSACQANVLRRVGPSSADRHLVINLIALRKIRRAVGARTALHAERVTDIDRCDPPANSQEPSLPVLAVSVIRSSIGLVVSAEIGPLCLDLLDCPPGTSSCFFIGMTNQYLRACVVRALPAQYMVTVAHPPCLSRRSSRTWVSLRPLLAVQLRTFSAVRLSTIPRSAITSK